MKRMLSFAAVLMMVFALQACSQNSGNTASRLDGRWVCDMNATVKAMAGGAQVDEQMLNQMGAAFRDMTLTVDSSKNEMTIAMGGQTETSKYEIVSEKDGVYTIKIDQQTTELTLGKNDNGQDMLGFQVPGSGLAQKVFFTKAQ